MSTHTVSVTTPRRLCAALLLSGGLLAASTALRAADQLPPGSADAFGSRLPAGPMRAQASAPQPPTGDDVVPEVSFQRTSRAVAVLAPTEGSDVRGRVIFSQLDDGGVQVESTVHGLPSTRHAYHVHLYGDCTAADASSAGTHFNFIGNSNSPPSDIDRITGNLGDLEAGSDGNAEHRVRARLASLTGPWSIVGRAVVVHEKPNDPDSPPMGDAGGRLACGVIGFGEMPAR